MTRIYLILLFVFIVQASKSQGLPGGGTRDSLIMTMQQAEDSLLTKNLSLIAQHYSIDSARATVITAKLWDNPELDFSNGLYNSVTHHFFDPEESAQISQLI